MTATQHGVGREETHKIHSGFWCIVSEQRLRVIGIPLKLEFHQSRSSVLNYMKPLTKIKTLRIKELFKFFIRPISPLYL